MIHPALTCRATFCRRSAAGRASLRVAAKQFDHDCSRPVYFLCAGGYLTAKETVMRSSRRWFVGGVAALFAGAVGSQLMSADAGKVAAPKAAATQPDPDAHLPKDNSYVVH